MKLSKLNTKIGKVKSRLLLLHAKQKGLTTVEYAVAGSLIALAVVVAFTNLGATVGTVINNIESVIAP